MSQTFEFALIAAMLLFGVALIVMWQHAVASSAIIGSLNPVSPVVTSNASNPSMFTQTRTPSSNATSYAQWGNSLSNNPAFGLPAGMTLIEGF